MNTILPIHADRRWSYVTAAGPVLSAWLALALWSISPYAAWLDHAQIEDIEAALPVRLVVFTFGWTLMIIATMLPSTLLLLDRCLAHKPLSAGRIAPALLAYLAVWTVFGSVIYLADGVLHEIAEQAPALAGVIAPGVLLVAGVYQFTPIKRACLLRCRPEGAVFTSFGQSRSHNDWIAGARHGVFCLGSGWAVMLLMFAIGGVNLSWMLVLGITMMAERLDQRGEYVAQCLGMVLIIGAALLVAM